MSHPLFHPPTYDATGFDEETRRLLRATIDWFEARGKSRLLADYRERNWTAEFLEFVASEKLFSTLLTPPTDADDDPNKRWDTSRISALSEILGFYGLDYWYTWQVTILGLGPVWQSDNAVARQRVARLLDEGAVAAFGLSERAHGADIYSTDMILTPDGDGGFTASGSKYYIGNGNVARIVSVFGRRSDVEGPEGYVFFLADSQHASYELVQNTVDSQKYVAEFRLNDYPVSAQDILHTGQEAFSAALNTVNIGKFNIGFTSIGMVEHCTYEAVTHAHNRILYGHRVTDFAHVRSALNESFVRLTAMKLYSARAIDYLRSASATDRRYLLFNPVSKMKVTSEGERAIASLWDVIAAKGFEKDTYFLGAGMNIGAPAKLEGTVHVNLALILKFMPAYLLSPQEQPAVPVRRDAATDDFLFHQGPARGLGSIRFADWHAAFEPYADLPNVALFRDQADGLAELLRVAPPSTEQQSDLDFTLELGQLFTLLVYAQLVLEQAALVKTDAALVDAIFQVLVRDYSQLAVRLHGRGASTHEQQEWALRQIRKPVVDADRDEQVWELVKGISGSYEMTP